MPVVDRVRVVTALPGYTVGEELGAGAFGLVLAGHHRDLDRKVAVKVLTAAASGPAVADFRAEARLLSRLDHPHIVTTYDYVGHGDLCVLVMELLSGGTLARRQLSPQGACAVALAVADALGHAHAAGILHRDIKPGNILFTAAGQPKITDFGIAKIFEGTASTASRVVGTPRYMAPEQITGDRLGPATDLYALAVVLYELLTGAPMFDLRLSIPELLRHNCDVLPPPPAGVPEPVARVVMRALAKRPAERYPTLRDFAVDLARAAARVYGRQWIAQSGITLRVADELRDAAAGKRVRRSGGDSEATRRAATRRKFWRWIPAAALVSVIAVVAGIMFIPEKAPPPAPAPPPPPAWQPVSSPPGRITTVIGTGTDGFSGDDGLAIQAELKSPEGMAVDSAGNFYVADGENQRIRRIDPKGIITTVAGSGTRGFTGDNGPAREAQLRDPSDVAVDAAGNVYIADSYNHRIRRVDVHGTITTFAGTGAPGFSGDNEPEARGFAGDNVPAVQARLNFPNSIVLDPSGNLYISDMENNRIRRVDTKGIITTIAGTGAKGFSGDGGPATHARFKYPNNLALDAAGNLYISDQGSRIRRVDVQGIITTIAGTGVEGFSGDGGPATEAKINTSVAGVAVDAAGNLYLAEAVSRRVRRVDTKGIITTIAGTGVSGSAGINGPAAEAELRFPRELVVDSAGNLYIADSVDNRIRAVRMGG